MEHKFSTSLTLSSQVDKLLERTNYFTVNAEKKLGKRGSTVVMADGSQVEELNALRDNDRLFIF